MVYREKIGILDVLDVLADGRSHYLTSICTALECGRHTIDQMAADGLVVLDGIYPAAKITATPRGLELLRTRGKSDA